MNLTQILHQFTVELEVNMFAFSIFLRSLYLCLVLASCHAINERIGLPDDNFAEETLEEVLDTAIQYETGFKPDIDLTPGSPEK